MWNGTNNLVEIDRNRSALPDKANVQRRILSKPPYNRISTISLWTLFIRGCSLKTWLCTFGYFEWRSLQLFVACLVIIWGRVDGADRQAGLSEYTSIIVSQLNCVSYRRSVASRCQFVDLFDPSRCSWLAVCGTNLWWYRVTWSCDACHKTYPILLLCLWHAHTPIGLCCDIRLSA